MDFAEFVSMLEANWDAVIQLAGILAVGVALTVQTLKVTVPAINEARVGYVALGTAAVLGALVTAGYFFPQFVPVGMAIYGIVLAADFAALGYKYLAKPILSRVFPKAEITTNDLS
jgi:hypothetical protein